MWKSIKYVVFPPYILGRECVTSTHGQVESEACTKGPNG
jgi:hypothetical protein